MGNRTARRSAARPNFSDSSATDRLWPLDVLIATLAAMALYLICTRLRLDDERWQYNAATYIVGIPLVALAADYVLRSIASRYVQKSLQIGFLFSVCLHLFMLTLATGVVIFNQYYPEAVMGRSPDRRPVKRTVPEYLFKTAEKRDAQPDWSQPSQTDTASLVVPKQERSLPPVQQTAPRLTMPRLEQPIAPAQRPRLQRRDQPVESEPQPADSPARLARRPSRSDQPLSSAPDQPAAADVRAMTKAPSKAIEPDAALALFVPQQRARQIASTPKLSSPVASAAAPSPEIVRRRSVSSILNDPSAMPKIGDLGVARQRPSTARTAPIAPAGAAPSIDSVAVARQQSTATRVLSPVLTTEPQRGQQDQSLSTTRPTPQVQVDQADQGLGVVFDAARRRNPSATGTPQIAAGEATQRPSRRPTGQLSKSPQALGIPDPAAISAAMQLARRDESRRADSEPSDQPLAMRRQDLSRSDSPQRATIGVPKVVASPGLDLVAPDGPVGFAESINRRSGVVPTDQPPRIAAVDLTVGTRPRREVGGPVTPQGTEIAAVESFNRRVMRTRGGSSPTPAGAVGPATEEAIERGLAYLQSIQNEDGSWSLQGHGTKVILRSDTAATGLCLLAFQGAGYTHRQHQFASTVRKGIDFLTQNQKTSGDLFRSEDPISNQNVALYSHGIAALALSEAYGMTQDPQLRPAAQAALDYIANSQHQRRGGWRYTPQVSADTSVSGWMMMALKSGQLSGLDVSKQTYQGIDRWLSFAQSPRRRDRYRYDPFAPDTPSQRHGRSPTPTMTSVGMLMRMYSGWQRDRPEMQSAAEYLLKYPPQMGTRKSPQRDAYYWYYATQVMFHMGDNYWQRWNQSLNPVLLKSQRKTGSYAGSWDPVAPVPDRWSRHAGRLYVTTMNLLNLEVYYRHLPIYEDTAR